MDKNMILFFGKKLVVFAVSMFVLSLTVFYVARFAPGDPLVSYYGDRVEKMSQEEREKAEERLGLREPVHIQYVKWLENAVHGDFGISYKYKRNVLEVIQGRLFNTLVLGGVGFILIFGLALLPGILCVWFEERLVDRIICQIGVVTSCIPEFWFSLVLILIFSVWLKVFPSSGAYSMGRSQDVGDRIFHLILPMTIVVTSHLWYYAYMIRNKLLEEVRADYVLLAKAKGLGKAEILLGHCLRGIMPSYLSLMAVSVSHILGGTYMVEMVFSYPGIGTLSYESARYKDYNLLMVLCIFSGAIVILCSIIAQAINERIDPGMGSREDGR